MKKEKITALIAVLTVLIVCFTACNEEIQVPEETQVPNALLPQMIIDDTLYLLSGDRPIFIEIDDIDYLGRIVSVVPLSQIPKENGEANFCDINTPYALHEEGIIVLWGNSTNEWNLFVTEENFYYRIN